MSCTTFCQFSSLPYEIRHLIWKAAIRPRDPNTVGIHNISAIDVYPTSSQPRVVLPSIGANNERYHIVAVTECNHPWVVNRSAYQWDAGLWAACWESRDTIMSCFNMTGSGGEAQNLIQEHRRSDFARDYLTGKTSESDFTLPMPIRALPRQNTSAWRVPYLVHPYQDAFKLSPEMMVKWTEQLQLREDWINDFYNFPSELKMRYKAVKNLVVEFDPSWNREWPDSLHKLLREQTPRGMVSTILVRTQTYHVDVVVWLVDRGDRKHHEPSFSEQNRVIQKTFYDFDEKYVQIKMTTPSRMNDAECDTALHFVTMLAELSDQVFGESRWYAPDLVGDHGESVGNVGVLVPRRNAQIL